MKLRIRIIGAAIGFVFQSLAMTSAVAEIREVKSFAEVAPFVQSDTLLVTDIDNTLIRPVTAVGSDEWFYYLYDRIGKKPTEDVRLDQALMKIWNDVQSEIQVVPAETMTPGFLSKKQESGIKTIALTARNTEIFDVTARQLRSAGYHFEKNTIYNQEVVISKEELGTDDPAIFRNGILAVGESNSKGEVFGRFLKRIGFQPKHVVFVDDKEKHVKTMNAVFAKLKIPFQGFRYGAVDARVKEFQQKFMKKG